MVLTLGHKIPVGSYAAVKRENSSPTTLPSVTLLSISAYALLQSGWISSFFWVSVMHILS